MNRIETIKKGFQNNLSVRTVLAVLVGNVILGLGCAGLRLSMMGNDPYTASTIAISTGLHLGLGNYQLALNVVLMVIQVIWGYKYIGFGTIVNMCLLGYFVQFFSWFLGNTIGSAQGKGIVYCLVYMIISLVILSFGLAMYQAANLGIAPYDYLPVGLADKFKKIPYFFFRVMMDSLCVLIIVTAVLGGLIGWSESDLGIGTIITALCLGPLVSLFTIFHKKWIE